MLVCVCMGGESKQIKTNKWQANLVEFSNKLTNLGTKQFAVETQSNNWVNL